MDERFDDFPPSAGFPADPPPQSPDAEGEDADQDQEEDLLNEREPMWEEFLRQRQESRREYVRDVLSRRDPLRKNVGLVAADLMWLSMDIMDLIIGEMPDGIEGYAQYKSAVDGLLRVQRQLDRFTQLDALLADKARQAPASSD